MELTKVQKVICEGLKFDKWSDEQQEAMRVALKCVMKMEQIEEEAQEFYSEEIDLLDFGERVIAII